MTTKISKVLQAALEYEKHGWSVIPLHGINKNGYCTCKEGKDCENPGKHSRVLWREFQERRPTADDIRSWWQRWPRSNIGIITGKVSGLIVLDIDGLQGEETLRREKLHVPATVISRTGGGGWHYFFKHPGFECRNFAGKSGETLLPNVDFRGDGGLIVVPPSRHRSGNLYEWAIPPEDSAISDAPEWLLELIKKQAGLNGGGKVHPEDWEKDIPEGQRNDTLARLAGSLFSKNNIPDGQIFEMIWFVNLQRCKPPLDRKEVEEIVKSVAKTHKRNRKQSTAQVKKFSDSTSENFIFGDIRNAQRLREEFNGDMFYSPERKKWIRWSGKVWEIDLGEAALYSYVKQVINAIAKAAIKAPTREEQEALFKEALSLSSLSKQKSMIEQCSKERAAQIFVDDLDADPWLFCCENGTIDLRTGDLRPHRREDFITKMSPVAYDPNAKSEVFEAYLERVLPDKDVRQYVQKAGGYSLTGSVAEEKLFFAFGPQAGGKSTMIEAIRSVLGPHAVALGFDTLLKRKYSRSGEARPDLAKLVGVRFASAVEAGADQEFDEELINRLTGGDTVTARHLYGEEFDFKPVVKLWLASNNMPSVSGPVGAIWRRLRLIPFNLSIPENERDKTLKIKLQTTEKPAILAWLVEGCLAWQKEGLKEPAAVRALTSKEQNDSDPLKFFLEDCCILKPDATVRNPELWAAYLAWAKANKIKPLGRKTFSQMLMARPGIDNYTSNGKIWTGIGLLAKTAEETPY